MKTARIENVELVWKSFKPIPSAPKSLILHYLPLVKYTADRIWAKLPDKVEVDDLISAGIFGLKDAIDAFDPHRGVSFKLTAPPAFEEASSMNCEAWIGCSTGPGKSQSTDRAMQTLRPTWPAAYQEELAEEMELERHEFYRLQRDATAIGLVSLNTKFNESDGDKDIREIDIIEDQRSKNPVIEAQKRDLKNLLTKGLTRSEKLIIILYYYEEMTMKEIGATLDLSESRVSQMHSSIIARLKAQMNSRKKEFAVMT